ncbi:hypothetical protein [Arundinibacter roseus]|uniref:DUF3311 domain-containing protein n=1 Tax=Arundinibacter roseus TaxID=2070510 RepID=A0A4R4KN36_9BACT|nr:hypothetical protein [Arundinibacter roseus]TDB67961.1 hypothetical protein EZE20_03275 [Arundinibacter roseus]
MNTLDQRLAALSLLAALLLNTPLLRIANTPATFRGIPLFYLYILLVWLLMIGLLIYFMHTKKTRQP